MSLLGELWGGRATSGLTGKLPVSESEVAGKLPVSPELASGLQPKAGKSYSEAVSSSSGELFSRIAAQGEVKQKPKMLSGAKRPRSPTESSCGRCFRTMHKTADCRHQVVCLRCSGVGHVAAHCKAEMRRSPKKNRVHIRSKRKLDSGDQSRMGPRVNHVCSPPPHHVLLCPGAHRSRSRYLLRFLR